MATRTDSLADLKKRIQAAKLKAKLKAVQGAPGIADAQKEVTQLKRQAARQKLTGKADALGLAAFVSVRPASRAELRQQVAALQTRIQTLKGSIR
jgi:hypothetical protein